MKVIDLFSGWPNANLLPKSALSDAFAAVMTAPSIRDPALQYGPDEGYEPLRHHIAHWLTAYYRPPDPISPARICITGGASQNLACLLQVFTDPIYTRNVWMVAPTYHLAGRIMEDSGFAGRLRAISQNQGALELEGFRQELRKVEERARKEENDQPKSKPSRPWAKIYKHIIYTTPTFSNPSTLTMSLEDRENLVRLAREFDALIISDDVYDFLQWPSDDLQTPLPMNSKALLPRVVDIDRYLDGGPQDEWGNAVSNGSFSKLIGPGMRTGWAEGTEKLAYGISQTGSTRSGGAPSQFASAIIDQLLPSGFLQHYIDQVLRPAYSRRYHRMMLAIHEHLLPLGVTIPFPASSVTGGYFIWLELPRSVRASDLAPAAGQNHGVRVAPGDLFGVQGDPTINPNEWNRFLRVCFAWESEEKLGEGIRRLGEAIRDLTTPSSPELV
ncbi:hypothetical protein ARAM_000742 [Aspergillus rambellii]|uniref:Aminotransferase class I/classII large domain-containing protein n=1 Tax=Aspergillus rambellii TaxID=308745 RepID=A0A0F8UEN6_9EURO|nr:hypothetical protein ARAM_000742 [Aspergillus rambellii]